METFQTLLAKRLVDALAKAGFPNVGELTQATDSRFGDYQTNAALILGKQRGENPRDVGAKILERLDVSDLSESPTVLGAGFINFTLRADAVAKKAAELFVDERLGVARSTSPKKIVIDFGSPNVAKPMHVGRIYKETNARSTSDPAVREACRQELVKLQSGDKESTGTWNECVALSMQDFEHVYELLDVHYDIQCGESFYDDRLAGVVDRLLKSKIAEVSESAVVVFFRGVPELADKPCIIRKSDGGFNYATSDIATVEYRINELTRDTVWYVVGAPQTLHFRQIFEIARREGYKADFRHIPFGNVLGEDRKLMKTRSGENVPLRQLLEEASARARKIVDEKNPDLSDTEKI